MQQKYKFVLIIIGLFLCLGFLTIEQPSEEWMKTESLLSSTFTPSAFVPPVEKNLGKDNLTPVLATVPFSISLENVSISGVTTADLADRITITKILPNTEEMLTSPQGRGATPLNQGMVNVTPDGAIYRMLPDGTQFGKNIDIVLPYDTARLPMGFTPNDIMTYYYDTRYGRWIVIERDSVDTEKQLIVSKVNHFTDFVNAIIQTPEMPETSPLTFPPR